MRSIFLGSLFAAVTLNSAFATSAYLIAPFCNVANDTNPFYSGICSGIVEMIIYSDKEFGVCVPDGVTHGEGNLVVFKYANDHPEMLHLEMASIALAALKNAWPCPPSGK